MKEAQQACTRVPTLSINDVQKQFISIGLTNKQAWKIRTQGAEKRSLIEEEKLGKKKKGEKKKKPRTKEAKYKNNIRWIILEAHNHKSRKKKNKEKEKQI